MNEALEFKTFPVEVGAENNWSSDLLGVLVPTRAGLIFAAARRILARPQRLFSTTSLPRVGGRDSPPGRMESFQLSKCGRGIGWVM